MKIQALYFRSAGGKLYRSRLSTDQFESFVDAETFTYRQELTGEWPESEVYWEKEKGEAFGITPRDAHAKEKD
jgi:hypothetical protein